MLKIAATLLALAYSLTCYIQPLPMPFPCQSCCGILCLALHATHVVAIIPQADRHF